jgi:hypothetical protein
VHTPPTAPGRVLAKWKTREILNPFMYQESAGRANSHKDWSWCHLGGRFVSGHAFRHAAPALQSRPGFSRCGLGETSPAAKAVGVSRPLVASLKQCLDTNHSSQNAPLPKDHWNPGNATELPGFPAVHSIRELRWRCRISKKIKTKVRGLTS